MAELFANPLTDEVVLNLVSAGAYFLVGMVVIAILMKLIQSFMNDKEVKKMLERLGIGKHALDMLYSALRLYFYFILFLIILGRLGISSVLTDLIIVLLILSVIGVILLSLRNVIPNAAAGLFITSGGMIRKGDKIKLDDLEGEVEEVTLINTVLKKGKTEKIIIPNSLLMKHKVIKK